MKNETGTSKCLILAAIISPVISFQIGNICSNISYPIIGVIGTLIFFSYAIDFQDYSLKKDKEFPGSEPLQDDDSAFKDTQKCMQCGRELESPSEKESGRCDHCKVEDDATAMIYKN